MDKNNGSIVGQSREVSRRDLMVTPGQSDTAKMNSPARKN